MSPVRSLSCPNCGAPLRWKGAARVIECAYCKTHIVADTRTITGEPSTAIATKPPPFPLLAIVGFFALSLLAAGIFAVARGGGAGGLKRFDLTEMREIELNQSSAQFVSRRGGTIRSGCIYQQVDHEDWGGINFCWDPPGSPHVTSVNIGLAKQDPDKTLSDYKPLPAEALKRAQAVFGRQLIQQASGGWHFFSHGVSFYLSSSVGISVQKKPGWESHLDALWRVLRHVVLGDPFELGPTEQAALNVGYTLDGLEKIDSRLPVKQAAAELARVYPGVEVDGARFDVGLEHPWFRRATVFWNNTLEGGLESIVLPYHTGVDFVPFQRRLESCITTVAGKPEVTIIDPLKDTKNYFWTSKGRPNVTVSHQSLVFRWNQPFDLAQHRAYLRAIANCKP